MAQINSNLTSTTLHALQQPSPQRYIPSFLRKDFGPSQLFLCVDHEGEILCLPLDFFQAPKILSTKGKPPPTKYKFYIYSECSIRDVNIHEVLHQTLDNWLQHILFKG